MTKQTDAQKDIIDRIYPLTATVNGCAKELFDKTHISKDVDMAFAQNRFDKIERLTNEIDFLRRLYFTIEYDKEGDC